MRIIPKFRILFLMVLLASCSTSSNKSSGGNNNGNDPEDPDTEAPFVTFVSSNNANGTYDLLDKLTINVYFSESVVVTGSPTLTLETGTTDYVAQFLSASNNIVSFSYEVMAGHSSADLSYVSTDSLDLAGGAIKDDAGNSAEINLPAIGSGTSLSGTKALVIGRNWNLIDGNAATSINKVSTNNANAPSLIFYNNVLYAAWSEGNIDEIKQIRVARYNSVNNTWTFVDGNDANLGINKNTTKNAVTPELRVLGTNLYCFWSEEGTSASNIRVKRYNGTTWTFVDGNGDDGINYDTTKNATNPRSSLMGNNLYVAWSEDDGSVTQIRVARFNVADTNWSFIDGGNAVGLNKDDEEPATRPFLAAINNILYATWREVQGGVAQIRVARYNGTNWAFVDGNGASGLNMDITKNANMPNIASLTNELYLTWSENNGTTEQIRAKKYNGTIWTTIDDGGSTGLNKNTSHGATEPKVSFLGTRVYISWVENGQVRVKKYNGTDWAFVDGDGATGLNKNTAHGAGDVFLRSNGTNLFLTWLEDAPAALQIHVRSY